MPAINIPAAQDTNYAALINPRQRRATAEATEANARLNNSSALLNEQSADYYDKTGESEASQRDAQIYLENSKLNEQMRQFNYKMTIEGSEDDQRRWNMFKEISATAYSALSSGMSPDKVNAAYQNQLKLAGIYEDAQVHGMGTLPSMQVLGSLAHTAKSIDNLETVNFLPADAKGDMTKMIAIDRNDPNYKKVLAPYALPGGAGYKGSFLTGLGNAVTGIGDPLKDKEELRSLWNQETAHVSLIQNIDKAIDGVGNLETWQQGKIGDVLRSVSYYTSAIADATKGAANAGIDMGNGDIMDEQSYLQKKMQEFSGPSAAQDQLYFNIAYAKAKAAEGTGSAGRLSDQDVINQMHNLKGSKADVKAVLEQMRQDSINAMQFKYVQMQQKSNPEIPEYMKQYMQPRQEKASQGGSTPRGSNKAVLRAIRDKIKAGQDLTDEEGKLWDDAHKSN